MRSTIKNMRQSLEKPSKSWTGKLALILSARSPWRCHAQHSDRGTA